MPPQNENTGRATTKPAGISATPANPAKIFQIKIEMERLEKALSRTEGTMITLGERLSPIMRPEEPREDTPKEEKDLVDLADAINRATERVNDIESNIYQKIELLEI